MSDFNKAFAKFNGIEFSNSRDVLHRNKKENGLTFWGIYESAHATWSGWGKVYETLKYNSLSQASEILASDKEIIKKVKEFYKKKFWDKLRLNLVENQKIAEELFFFYLNTGNKKRTIKMAQIIIKVKVDGFIGIETINALNNFDEKEFDRRYDIQEIEYYARLVQSNSNRYLLNLVGWIKRAVKI